MKHSPTRLVPCYIIALSGLAACAGPPAVADDAPPPTVEVSISTPVAAPTTLPESSPTPQSVETPLPGQIVDEHGITMLLVPAGEFIMGSDLGFHDELPVHTVFLDAFYMDLYEVTNADYAKCVAAGGCTSPKFTGSRSRYYYYGEAEYDNYPAVYLSWYDADNYCRWRGVRLPTEAEWEKATRGTDGRTYAWGDERPDASLTNYAGSNIWDTVEVGSYPAGVSPYGLHDMTGSVYEWVSDWYAEDYYRVSPEANPTGPTSGSWRVTKGGSFWNWDYRLRAANRNNTYLPPDSVHWDGGARCARSP